MIPYSATWLYSNIGARTPSTSYTSHTLSIPMSSTRTRTKATIGDQPACVRRSEEEQTELASCHPWESVEHMALLVVIASQLLASIVWCARRKKGQNWIWMYHAIFVHSGRRRDYIERWRHNSQERPYNHDSTASRLLSEVKHDLARLVLRWGTTLESLVLFFCLSSFYFFHPFYSPKLTERRDFHVNCICCWVAAPPAACSILNFCNGAGAGAW